MSRWLAVERCLIPVMLLNSLTHKPAEAGLYRRSRSRARSAKPSPKNAHSLINSAADSTEPPSGCGVVRRARNRGRAVRLSEIYFIVPAPALQTCASSAAVPPLQPIAPITLLSANSGKPPSTAMTPSVKIASAGGLALTAS
jgi:hypothetical protein